MSHSSFYQPAVTSALCVSPVRITTATFSSHIPNICYTNASIRFFSSKLKTTSSLKSSLSSRQKYAPTSATKSPCSSDPTCVSSPPVKTLSISSHKNSDRAASVPHSNLPSNIVVSSVNSLNSSYVARTKPLPFKTMESLVPKSLAPFKTSVCINSSNGKVSNGAVSDSTNSLVLRLCSILFLILSKWQTSILLILVTFIFQAWVNFLHLLPQNILHHFCPYWYHF